MIKNNMRFLDDDEPHASQLEISSQALMKDMKDYLELADGATLKEPRLFHLIISILKL